jgi:hypothetical protein
MRPVDIVIKLIGTGDPETQRAIIKEAWTADLIDFFIGLEIATNPKYDLGISSVFEIQDDDDGLPGDFTFLKFQDLVMKLSGRELAGPALKNALEQAAMTANITEWNLWYRKILLKKLHEILPMLVIRDTLLELTTE